MKNRSRAIYRARRLVSDLLRAPISEFHARYLAMTAAALLAAQEYENMGLTEVATNAVHRAYTHLEMSKAIRLNTCPTLMIAT